jgi:hypothetical protein
MKEIIGRSLGPWAELALYSLGDTLPDGYFE